MKTRFVVLGGCGAIGRTVVRDAVKFHPKAQIVVADFNADAARTYANTFKKARVTSAFADATKPVALAKMLRGATVVINCTQHTFNLNVMTAALKAGVHYVDLGGLFYWTRKQLKLHTMFMRAGLVAVLGGGCAPGITNVLARRGVEVLGGADSIRIRVGTIDFNPPAASFCFPYSAQTIVEEMTLTPWIYSRGKFREIKARSRWEPVDFPKPVGRQWTICTRHSEIATLPLSFQIKQCDFCVSFDRGFVNELVKRLRAGQTVSDFRKLPAPRGKPDDYEVARVIVRRGKKEFIADCHAKANRAWHASAGDIDTGCPPSIIAGMMAEGSISEPGVWAPEIVVPVAEFFRQLQRRGMKITERIQPAAS